MKVISFWIEFKGQLIRLKGIRHETQPNPENATAGEVLTAMKAAPTGKIYKRLEAIYMLLMGEKKEHLLHFKMYTGRSLNLWIRQFNESGIDGLYEEPKTGRPPELDERDRGRLAALIENPKSAGEVFWTGKKLHGYLSKEWGKGMGYSTLMATLGRMNYVQKVPRSWPIKQDEQAREGFRKKIESMMDCADSEVWFADETGIQGDPRPRRRWVKKGEKCELPYLGTHLRENVIGAVCPRSGEFVSLVMPYVDAEVFQIFLNEVNTVTGGRKITMVLDNATWHKAKKLRWGAIQPMNLPAYSPDLNPIERLWLVLKARYFTDWIARTQEELSDRVVEALRSFLTAPDEIISICSKRN